MKYVAIQAHQSQFSVALMCRVLGAAARASMLEASEPSVPEPGVMKNCARRSVLFIRRAAAPMAARASMPSCVSRVSGADAKGSPA